MATTIDDALEVLANTGMELLNGGSNHGPMVAETLITLDRSEEVLPWIERYKSRLQERARTLGSIPRDDWREALGERGRMGDWIVFFERELAESPPA